MKDKADLVGGMILIFAAIFSNHMVYLLKGTNAEILGMSVVNSICLLVGLGIILGSIYNNKRSRK